VARASGKGLGRQSNMRYVIRMFIKQARHTNASMTFQPSIPGSSTAAPARRPAVARRAVRAPQEGFMNTYKARQAPVNRRSHAISSRQPGPTSPRGMLSLQVGRTGCQASCGEHDSLQGWASHPSCPPTTSSCGDPCPKEIATALAAACSSTSHARSRVSLMARSYKTLP